MFKNKHVIVAMIVAPVLAILSYLGVDRLVSEEPHVAIANASYPLAARSGCRYASGECQLHNGDLDIALKPALFSDQEMGIQLTSSIPIDGAMVALSNSSEDGVPVAFESDDEEKLEWITTVPVGATPAQKLRLVVFTGETRFFAEVDTVFLIPDTPMLER